jgi:hypothetical protein
MFFWIALIGIGTPVLIAVVGRCRRGWRRRGGIRRRSFREKPRPDSLTSGQVARFERAARRKQP